MILDKFFILSEICIFLGGCMGKFQISPYFPNKLHKLELVTYNKAA
jgi:hypothetical protein